MKIKPDSEISSHITLINVISDLFHAYIFTEVVCIRVDNSWCEIMAINLSRGSSTPPADILAAALTWLGGSLEEGSYKNPENWQARLVSITTGVMSLHNIAMI